MGRYYAIAGLIVQAALLVFAIRAYRARPSRVSLCVMWATVCYVLAASSWYTFYFTAGLFLGAHPSPHPRHTLADFRFYSDQTFQILFAALMIAALISFMRERS